MSAPSSPSRLLAFMLCALLAVPFYAVPSVAAASDEAVLTGVQEWSAPQTIVGPIDQPDFADDPDWNYGDYRGGSSIAVDSVGRWHLVHSSYLYWDYYATEPHVFYEGNYLTYQNVGYSHDLVVDSSDTEPLPWGWTTIGSRSIAVGPDDEMHVVYFARADESIKYMTNVSGAWSSPQTVVGHEGSGVLTSFDVDSEGTWHLVYTTNSGPSGHGSSIAYMSALGHAYDLPIGHLAEDPVIVVGPDDSLHVAYRADGDSVKYLTNASGAWSSPQTIASSVGSLSPSSFVVDAKGVWHLVCSRFVMDDFEFGAVTFHLTYLNALGAEYDLVVNDHSDTRPAIALGPNDSLHVSYTSSHETIAYMSRSGTPQQPVGEVVKCSGDAKVSDEPATPGDQIHSGDELSVGDEGHLSAELSLGEGVAEIDLGPGTEVKIADGATEEDMVLEMIRGKMRALLKDNPMENPFEVIHPQAVAAVRGTEWIIEADETICTITVLDGEVEVSGTDEPDSELVGSGYAIEVTAEGRGEPYPIDLGEVDRWWEEAVDPDPDPDPDPLPPVISIAGAGRYDTAIEASKEAYPDGLDPAGHRTVVIATGRNWPDALGGSALAGALDGPILLVPGTSVPAVVATEITRLGATTAIIVGGEVAVDPAVVTALQGAGLTVERVAGGSRYTTADAVALRTIQILKAQGGYDGTAFVATGGSYADAVAAAPLAAANGWPLYLAHPTAGVRPETLSAMGEVNKALVLGGENAVSATAYNALAGRFSVDRLGGATRYATAVTIATYGVQNAGLSWNRVGIATGQSYPDALAGGVLQGKVGSVMLLTRTNSLPDETAGALADNTAVISTVTYFGGELAVSAQVRSAVAQILQ